MKKKIPFIVFVFLIFIISAELFIYNGFKRDIAKVKDEYEKGKAEANNELIKFEEGHSEDKSFGYADILKLLENNSSFNITNIKRKENSKNDILVQIEFVTEESNIKDIIAEVYKMENLKEISKLSIRNYDQLKRSIILNGEFNIN